MISESMKDIVANSSAIRAMFEEGKKLAALHGAENVFDFSLGNPSVNPPPEIKKAIFDILENENENMVHGYMNNAGYEDVREAIAQSVNNEHKTSYGSGNVLMTVGAAGALNVVFKTLLNPGDEVIVFAPYFGEYKRYIENYGGKIIIVPPDIPGFQLDLQALESLINKKTKAVIINSPNNPSGVVYTKEVIKKLAEMLAHCEKSVEHPIYLVSDEPYRKIVYDDIFVPYITKYYKNTFIAYSYSKALSLPGERIGYLIVPGEMDYYNEIMPGLTAANRILGFVNSPSLFQRVVAKCVNTSVDLSSYEENRNVLYNSLTKIGYEAVKPEGAFYLFTKAPIDDAEFCSKAKNHNILIVPGRSFGCPGYFRIAYCVNRKTVINSINGFEKLYNECRG